MYVRPAARAVHLQVPSLAWNTAALDEFHGISEARMERGDEATARLALGLLQGLMEVRYQQLPFLLLYS